jgi:hypothetical protein
MNEILDDHLYSARELSKIKSFSEKFGSLKLGEVKESTVYHQLMKAIKKGTLLAINRGMGSTPYYKILGRDAKSFVENHLSK